MDSCAMPVAVKEEGAHVALDNGMTLIDGTASGNRDMILAKTLMAYMGGEQAANDAHADVLSAFTRKYGFVSACPMPRRWR